MKWKFILSICIIISLLGLVSAALNVSLADHGVNVKLKSTGASLSSGNLTVLIYDAPTGGNLIYNETFVNKIINGSWNVMLGENSSNPLSLEFGTVYYKDYRINEEDLNFTNLTGDTTDRRFFYSPLGDIAGTFIQQNTNLTIGGNLSAGSRVFFVNNNTGRVGINTTTPQNTLNVVGTFNVTNTTGYNSFNVDSTGKVGIGTSSPNQKLAIIDTGGTSLYVLGTMTGSYPGIINVNDDTAQAAGSGGGIKFSGKYTTVDYADGAGVRAVKQNGNTGDYGFGLAFLTRLNGGNTLTERMRIDSSGKVGINMTTPQNTLNVVGDANFTGVVLSGGGSVTAPSYSFSTDNDTGTFLYGTNILGFTSGGTNTVVISSTSLISNVDMSGYGAGPKLLFSGSPAYNLNLPTVIPVLNDANTGIAGNNNDVLSLVAGGTATLYINKTKVGIGTSMPQNTLNVIGDLNVTVLGTASATAVCWDAGLLTTCSSSIRYKENITNVTASTALWNKYMQLQAVNFNFKNKTGDHLGLIAEDVYKIFPNYVFNISRPIYENFNVSYFDNETNQTITTTVRNVTGYDNEIEGIVYTDLTTANMMMIQDLRKTDLALRSCILNSATLAAIQTCVAGI